jgi:parallel beta-helix repeat protein
MSKDKFYIIERRCKMKSLILTAIVLFAVLSMFSVSAIDISSCGTLNVLGATYNQVSDIVNSGTDCIVISAPNITYNGNGYSIDRESGKIGSAIATNQPNTAITNTIIRNHNIGLDLNLGAEYSTITNNYIGDTASFGIEFGSYQQLQVVSNSVIKNNIIRNTGNDGIQGDNDYDIENNLFEGIGGTGIDIRGNNRVINNTIINPGNHGIEIEGGNCLVYKNNVTVKTRYGLLIGGSCNATDNYVEDIFVLGSDNVVKQTYPFDVYFQFGSNNNNIIDSNVKLASVVWGTNNIFLNTSIEAESIFYGSLIRKWYVDAEVTLNSNPAANAIVSARNDLGNQFSVATDENGNIPRQSLVEYINNGDKVYQSNYTIAAVLADKTDSKDINLSENVFVQLNLKPNLSVSSCRTLDVPGIYNQVSDIITSADIDCIVITAENITYDCNGYSVTRPSLNLARQGIVSNSYNTTIKNCKVSNSQNGIDLEAGADNSKLYNNTLTKNNWGILVNSVDRVLIDGNNASDNKWYGIVVMGDSIGCLLEDPECVPYSYSSSYDTITNNIANNNMIGVLLDNVHHSIVDHLTVSYNNKVSYFYGLQVGSGSSNLTLSNIESHHNRAYGVYISGINIVLKDSSISNSSGTDLVASGRYGGGQNIVALNTTYSTESVWVGNEYYPATTFYRKWYFDALALSNGNPVNQANIIAWNNLGQEQFSELTDSNGRISTQNLIEYSMIGANKTYYSYVVNATKDSSRASKNINLTWNVFEVFDLLPQCNRADFNKDGEVNFQDIAIFSSNYGRKDCSASNDWCRGADLNRDGRVSSMDIAGFSSQYGTSTGPCI